MRGATPLALPNGSGAIKVTLTEFRPTPQDVFPAVGKPTYTYVERDQGENERKLSAGLRNPGQICLLTGPSKTGKTSLYKSVLPSLKKDEIVIRCSGKLTSSEFWASALESLDFERLAERSQKWGGSVAAKIGVKGEAGWSWVAKVMSTIGFDLTASGEYAIKREVVKSALSAKHLIPLLKGLPLQLIVEDFHYLEDSTKVEVFQQWKAFVDEGVSVLVVSTTHHAIDIARANPDLSGRTRLIDVGKWSEEDLAQIPKKGFNVLSIKSSDSLNRQIAKESVGLPIIAQQLCQEIADRHDMSPGRRRSTFVQREALDSALTFVADNLYANHKGDYEQLITGPRRSQRKHATYEKIIASFALEPLKFSLRYHELIERVAKLSGNGEQIPTASIASSLKALGKFQARSKMRLLDWHEFERVLYIVEPSFLFYLRQKLDRVDADNLGIEQKLHNLFKMLDAQVGSVNWQIKMIRSVQKPDEQTEFDLE